MTRLVVAEGSAMARTRSFEEWLARGRSNPPLHLGRGPLRWKEIVTDWYPTARWRSGLDVEAAMNDLGGPFIEVGGPSQPRELGFYGGHIFDTAKLKEPLRISNVRAEDLTGADMLLGRAPFKRRVPFDSDGLASRIEVLLDAQKLPFRPGSVGMLTATALLDGDNDELMLGFLRSAETALKPEGFVIGESVTAPVVDSMLDLGFEPVRARRRWLGGSTPEQVRPQFDVIARKPGGKAAK